MVKTKIVCTLGPACSSEKMIKKMINASMDCARINMSHGTPESVLPYIEKVKKLRKETKRPIAIMIDTKGPECRIGEFKNGEAFLKKGQIFTLYNGNILGDENGVSYSYKKLFEDVKVGSKILVNDGLIVLKVLEIENKNIKTKVIFGGKLTNRKSMFLPGVKLSIPFLTNVDKNDLKFACEQNVDFVAASFVSGKDDVISLRNFLNKNGGENIKIISKIESAVGVKKIEEIIEESDGIMVARGDLGVEMPIEKLPSLQKMIIEKTLEKGKLTITATEMLESMTKSVRPTRAEVSDVANAVFDKTGAIMLSGETSVGINPENVVKTMASIAKSAEENKKFISLSTDFSRRNAVESLCHSACLLAKEVDAKAIVCFTSTGKTALLMSKFRPCQPILAITMDEKVYNQLALCYNVESKMSKMLKTMDKLIAEANTQVQECGFAKSGDKIIITTGYPVEDCTNTNIVITHEVK